MKTAVLIVYLLAQAVISSSVGPCSTEEMRQNAVGNTLATLGCENYTCVEYKVFPGLDASNPAGSCADIVRAVATAPSGYYWLQSTSGSPVRVYCDMSISCQGVGGGWMRVVNLDFSNTSQECPPDMRVSLFTPIRVCGITTDAAACSSSMFSVQGVTYSQVCGRIIGYQQGLTDAFAANRNGELSIDSAYFDGVSLTHGSGPRKHIWTFASARDEVGVFPFTNCPCTNTNQASSATQPPSYVGNDYFCDTGSTESAHSNPNPLMFYADDPLWDGAGCGANSTCCTFNNPPWFLKQLPSTTTDNIEMRICRDQHQTDERNHVEIVDLYIR